MAKKVPTPEPEEMLGEDFEIDVEPAPPPSDAELADVRRLAEMQVTLERRIANGEELLKKLKLALEEISERELPMKMKALGLTEFTMVGGAKITIAKSTKASIPKDMVQQAHAIIEKLGEGAIIKHTITIFFGRGEEAWARKFERDMALRKKPLIATRKDWIEPQTLGKFVRDRIAMYRAENRDPFTILPRETFGIYEGEESVVKLPKMAPAL